MNRSLFTAIVGAVLGAAFACGAMPAAAGTVTGTYTGIVQGVDAPLVGPFAVNDVLSFTFSYDDTTPDFSADPTFGQYFTGTATATVGSYTFTTNPGSVGVNDLPGGDNWGMGFSSIASGAAVNGLAPVGFSFQFNGPASVFSSDALPTSYLLPSLFTSSSFEVAFMDDQPTPHFYFLLGKLDIASAVTPIPAALPLFLTALGGLGLIARRRRTNA